ncbi:MAG: MG2 domain-containing protein [Atribacterota bacterium]
MKVIFFLILLLGIFCALPLLAQDSSGPVIVSIVPAPDSVVPLNLSEIKVTFSAEMVKSENVGMAQDIIQAPFRITPHLPGQFRWEDPKTLLVKLKGALKEATIYTFRFNDDFADKEGRLLSGRHDFTFKTAPLKVKEAKQVDYNPDGSIVIQIDFSLPVSPQKLRGFLTLKNEKGQEIPYQLPLGPASTKLFLTTSPLQSPTVFLEILAGLTSEKGPLGLETNYQKKLEATYEFEITGSYVYFTGPKNVTISFNTSTPPDPRTLHSFIQIDPSTPFTVRTTYYGFEITGNFAPRSRLVVTLKKGLNAQTGAKLQKDFVKAFIIPDVYPSIAFPTRGIYLSPTRGARIPVETVNVNRVKLSLWRIYENNLPLAFAEVYGIPPDLLSELVYEEVLFNDAQPNTLTRKAIDLEMLTGGKRGAYLLTAEDEASTWIRAEQIVILTDIAPTAKLFPRGILIWVNSLEKGQPIPGAEVKVLSRSNQILAQGKCDAEGVLFLEREEPWGEGSTAPYVVMVSQNGDVSFLVLRNELFALSGFDVTGKEYLRRGYETFLYLPRGVFRPGEKVDTKAILRGPSLAPPSPFPLLFTVVTPFGRTLIQKTVLLSEEGGAAFDFTLPENAPTGTYRIRCSLPGGENQPLGEKSFLVEEFTPPRMRLSLSCDRDFLGPGAEVDILLEGEYLFGTKASGIPYTGEVTIEADTFTHPNWQGFQFGNPEITFATLKLPLGEGILDEHGRTSVRFLTPADLIAPPSLRARFTFTLNDPAGRGVSQHLVLPFYLYPYFLGIKYFQKDQEPGQPVDFQVAVVKPDGNVEERITTLTARIYQVIRHYVLTESEGKMRYKAEEELSLQKEEAISLSRGMGKYTFTPSNYGEYLLEVSDPESGNTSTQRFSVYGKYGFLPEGEALFDRITMQSDQKIYYPGEEALITYQAPFAGKALITVETDRILFQKVIDVESGKGTITIPVTEAMSPNAYCSMTMVRKADAEEPLPRRALGTIPVFLNRIPTHLVITIDAPNTIRPKTTLPVQITVRDIFGNPVHGVELSLALVDVGLLQLTAEKTPDPWTFFNEKRQLTVGTFDPYNDLIAPELATTPLLHPAGGEAAKFLADEFAPLRPRAFKIVSFFLPTLKTDAQGKASAEFEIPDFDGRLKLVAVAMKGERFGSGEKEVLSTDKVVTEVVAPKAVAPGDAFEVALSIFSHSEYTETVEVVMSENGLVEIEGPKELRVEITPGGRIIEFITMKVKDLLGEGILTVKTIFSGGTREDRVSFLIRPITPRITLAGGGKIEPSERKRVDLPTAWLPGSIRGYCTIAPSPRVDLTRLGSFLFEYPYGCVEQTVSSAWGLLLLPDLLRDVDPLLVNESEIRNAMEKRIRRILSMQTYEGGFSPWPGGSQSSFWDSAYATHFLQEAQKRGWPIPQETLQDARNFLLTLLTLQPYSEEEWYLRNLFSSQAYAAYVLTLQGEAPLAWMEHLREKRSLLHESGLLLLALAYAEAGQKDVALELAGGYTPTFETAPQTGEIYESSLRKLALQLLLTLRLDPSSAQATTIVNRIRELLPQSEYLTTQESAFLVLALSEYFAGQTFLPYITFTMYDTTGREIQQFVNQEKVTLSTETLPSSFQIENQVSGRLFYLWNISGFPITPQKPWQHGIEIKRTYLNTTGNPQNLQNVKRGEILEVLLQVATAQPLENVVIVDPLPGGLEVENPRLATSVSYEGEEESSPLHLEIRDDRLILFIPNLHGTFEYRYTVRAITAGRFAIPQVKAECMYNPAISALGEEGSVVVRRE